MRRVLWISAAVLLVLLLFAGVIYIADPFSAGTWMLEKALRSDMESVRHAAASSLVQRDPERASEIFVDARAGAVPGDPAYGDSYGWFALLPPETAPGLAAILDDPDPLRAAVAADGLALLAHANDDHDFSAVLPALFRALERRNSSLCLSAASAIHTVDEGSEAVTKALLRASREGCPEVLIHLGGMELSDADASALIESLGHEDARLRAHAALVIGSLTAHREKAAPRLVAALRDPDASVVDSALRSLEELEVRDAATVREVVALLGKEEHASFHAMEFLARSTAASPEALAAVRTGLQDGGQAAKFLDELGNADPETISADLIPDLLRLCRPGGDLDQRLSAVDVLGNMGPRARSAAPAIEEILARDESDEFGQSARVALESMNAPE